MQNELILNRTAIQEIRFRNEGLSINTKERYISIVKGYFKYIKENGLDEGFESVKEWLRTIENPSTYNISLQGIKEYLLKRFEFETFEKKYELNKLLESIKRKKPKRAKTELDYLSKEMVEQLANITTETISCFILAMFWTGCRVSELLNIKLSDCKIKKIVAIRIQGKGSKEREVYMPVKLYYKINEIFKGKEHLFETKKGKRYSREFITHEIQRQAREKMNIDINSHLFRHSKAMFLKEVCNLSPDQVSKALGHSSVITTLSYYFHGTPTAKEQGIT